MNWFILSILAGLAFASSRVIARATLKKQGDPLVFTSIHDLIAGLVLLPFIWFQLELPTFGMAWLYFFGFVVFAFLTDWLAFLVLKNMDVSEYQIINQLRHIFILLGGFLLFSEAITKFKLLSVFLIMLGVIIAMYEKAKLKMNRSVIYAILGTFFAVITFNFAKLSVVDFSEIAMASFGLLAVALISFSFSGFQIQKIKNELKLNGKGIILSAILFSGFELALFMALERGEISRVIPVTQSSLIFTILAGVIFLNEKARLPQKTMGTILIGMGIAVMYVL